MGTQRPIFACSVARIHLLLYVLNKRNQFIFTSGFCKTGTYKYIFEKWKEILMWSDENLCMRKDFYFYDKTLAHFLLKKWNHYKAL